VFSFLFLRASLYLKLNTESVPIPPQICPLSPGHLDEQSLFEIATDKG
jgi:hypothetical protein